MTEFKPLPIKELIIREPCPMLVYNLLKAKIDERDAQWLSALRGFFKELHTKMNEVEVLSLIFKWFPILKENPVFAVDGVSGCSGMSAEQSLRNGSKLPLARRTHKPKQKQEEKQ